MVLNNWCAVVVVSLNILTTYKIYVELIPVYTNTIRELRLQVQCLTEVNN